MRVKYVMFTSLLCLGLLVACTGTDTQEEPPAQPEATRIPGALQNQFGALDKAKSLQNKMRAQQAAQERQLDDQSH